MRRVFRPVQPAIELILRQPPFVAIGGIDGGVKIRAATDCEHTAAIANFDPFA